MQLVRGAKGGALAHRVHGGAKAGVVKFEFMGIHQKLKISQPVAAVEIGKLLPPGPGHVPGREVAPVAIGAHPQIVQMLAPAQQNFRGFIELDIQIDIARVVFHQVDDQEDALPVRAGEA